MTNCIIHNRTEVPCHACMNDFLKHLEGKYVHKCGELTEEETGIIAADRVLLAYVSDSSFTPLLDQRTVYMIFPRLNIEGGQPNVQENVDDSKGEATIPGV